MWYWQTLGDLRQTLPIIRRGTMADEIDACLKSSILWRKIIKLKLTTNMRVEQNNDVASQKFAEYILKIGNGEIKHDNYNQIILDRTQYAITKNLHQLINSIYPNIQTNIENHKWLHQRSILAPKNENVDEINHIIMDSLPETYICYYAVDKTSNESLNAHKHPVEFSNTINLSGIPPYRLKLKRNAPIIFLGT